jgi:hypothetical protein
VDASTAAQVCCALEERKLSAYFKLKHHFSATVTNTTLSRFTETLRSGHQRNKDNKKEELLLGGALDLLASVLLGGIVHVHELGHCRNELQRERLAHRTSQ